MAKDGVVSISIEYKEQLNQMVRDYESALSNMTSNNKLSKGMKSQFDNTIAELKRFKADMEKSFSDLSIGKVDKNSFKSFKDSVNKNFTSVRSEIDRLDLAVSTINSQLKILENGVDISKISSQFKEFQDYVQNTNNAIDVMIKKLGSQGISLMSFDNSSVNQAKSQIKEIDKLLKRTNEFSDSKGSKYELFNIDKAQAELDVLARNLKNTLELIEKSESELSNFDKGSIGFEKTINQINILKLKAADLHDSIQQLINIPDKEGKYTLGDFILISDDNVDKKVSEYEKIVKGTLDEIRESAIRTREELEKIVMPTSSKTTSAKISDKLNPNSAELVAGVTIETTSSDLWKKLSPIINELQNDLNKNPVVAPVKLVVAPNAVSSDKNEEVGTVSKSYSKKYQKELAKSGKDAVIDLEGVYKKTFTSIMDEAVSYSKEIISKIQNIFESSPIKLHFDFNDEEFRKLSDSLLSSDSGEKIDITGQIAESKKEVNELAEKFIQVNELLNSTDSKDFSFKGFDKFSEEISKSLQQLTEFKSILKTLQNIEYTLARAGGVSTTTDIETQWKNVSKLIENSIKLDGTFRKNANVDKLAIEYNKYLNMGGNNELSSIEKINKLKDGKDIINTLSVKVKKLNSQKVDTTSIDKAETELKSVSSTLDDVISRLDHMINLTKDIGNTFWKMFKDASVSDIDKQWSSIESKFKSIADESGKINLSKQKKDIQELLEMYQKYTNAGGMKTPFDLTDNTETIKKLNKVYDRINSKTDVSSIANESKKFNDVEGSVNTLTSAINAKTDAIKTEANTMELAARAEVKSIQKIIFALNLLIEKIENIPELKILDNGADLPSKKTDESLSTNLIQKQDNALKELILSWAESQRIMTRSGSEPVEKLALANIDTGYVSNGNIIGGLNSISSKLINNVINATEEKINTMLHSHPDSYVAAFSPQDIQSAIIHYVEGLENQIVVAINEMSVMDVTKIKDVNPFDIAQKLQAEIDRLIDSYVKNKLQTVHGFQYALGNKFGYDNDTWKDLTDLLSERSNPDLLGKIIQKYKSEIKDNLELFDSNKTFNTSNELCDLIYDGVIKKYVNKYVAEVNPDISQSNFDTLHQKISENFKTTFSDMYEKILSIDDYRNLINDDDLQSVVKEAFSNYLKTIGLKYEDVIKTISIDQLQSSNFQLKDAIQGSEKKSETQGVKQVELATEEAIQAKKDFATANKDVQSSIDNSENPLKLEAELMEQIAKSARKAADAKKEFVKANKQVEDSANGSNNDLTVGHFENAEPSGVKKYKKKGYKAYDTGNHDNEKIVLNKAELSKTLKDLQSEIIASIDKTTSFVKEVTDFYDSNNNLVKTVMKVGDKNGGQRTYTTSYSKNNDGSATAWTSHIDTQNYEKQIKNEKKLISLKRKSRQQEKQQNQDNVNNALLQQEKSWKKIQDIKVKISKSNDSSEISYLQQIKKEYQQSYIEAKKILNINSSLYDKENQISKLKLISLNADKEIVNYKEKQNSPFTESQLKAVNKLNPYTDTSKYTQDFVNRVNDKIKNIKSLDITNPKDVKELEEIDFAIKEIISDSKLLENKIIKQDSKIADLIQRMKDYRVKNTAMNSSQKSELNALIENAEKLASSGKVTAEEFENIKKSFSNIKADVSETGNTGLNFVDQIRQRLTDMNTKFIAQYFSWQDWIRYIQQAVSEVVQLNTDITDLAKVSEQSVKQIYSDFSSYADIAKEMGGTISDTISATTAWAKNGYNIPDSKELARVSLLYKNVGDDITIDEANESLVSTLQGYKLAAKDAEHIIDVLNEVSNNEAISSAGIGEALQRSAASFNAANTSLEQSVALVTATRHTKLVEYMETYIKNIFNCHRSLYYHAPQYRGNYYMMV